MSEPSTQYSFLMAIFALTAIAWLGCALSAYATYRAFRLTVDLGWLAAYLLLAFVAVGNAFVANQWRGRIAFMPPTSQEASQFLSYYWLRLAPFGLIAAFLVFALLRVRRREP
jgi:hypothetical protein